jgi:hypothetical protein
MDKLQEDIDNLEPKGPEVIPDPVTSEPGTMHDVPVPPKPELDVTLTEADMIPAIKNEIVENYPALLTLAMSNPWASLPLAIVMLIGLILGGISLFKCS